MRTSKPQRDPKPSAAKASLSFCNLCTVSDNFTSRGSSTLPRDSPVFQLPNPPGLTVDEPAANTTAQINNSETASRRRMKPSRPTSGTLAQTLSCLAQAALCGGKDRRLPGASNMPRKTRKISSSPRKLPASTCLRPNVQDPNLQNLCMVCSITRFRSHPHRSQQACAFRVLQSFRMPEVGVCPHKIIDVVC